MPFEFETKPISDALDAIAGGNMPHAYFAHSGLTDDDAKALAKALRKGDGVESLNLEGNHITDAGMHLILDAITGMDTLLELTIENIRTTAAIPAHLARILPQLPSLMTLRCSSPEEGFLEELYAVAEQCRHKNLLELKNTLMQGTTGSTSWNCFSRPHMQENRHKAVDLLGLISQPGPEGLGLAQLIDIIDRWPSITHHNELKKGQVEWVEKRFYGFLDGLPTVDPGQPVTIDTLLTPDESGKTPLDNPRVWQQMSLLIAQAAEQGNPMTIEGLRHLSPSGLPYLAEGLLAAPAAIIRAFGKQGEFIDPASLLDPETNAPSALMESLIAGGTLGDVLNSDYCRHGNAQGWLTALRAVPEEAKGQIPNPHALQLQLSRIAQTSQLGRA